jgi:tetratricopeptide (TPR) repeat protein
MDTETHSPRPSAIAAVTEQETETWVRIIGTILVGVIAIMILGSAYHNIHNRPMMTITVMIVMTPADSAAALQHSIVSIKDALPYAVIIVCNKSAAEEWQNYQYSRNKCIASLPPNSASYVLLMNAGQEVHRTTSAFPMFNIDVSTVRVRNAIDYTDVVAFVRLPVLREQCRYHLWAGEYLNCSGSLTSGHLAALELREPVPQYDAVAVQQLSLLLAWLAQAYKNDTLYSRALFYTAQLMERRGDLPEARSFYEKQLAAGEAHSNYRFYALYSLARIQVQLSKAHNQVEELFWRILDDNHIEGSLRWEPRYYLARMARASGAFNQCILFAFPHAIGMSSLDRLQPLRMESAIYNWAMREEYAYCLSRIAGREEEAREHWRALLELSEEVLPADARERIIKNQIA